MYRECLFLPPSAQIWTPLSHVLRALWPKSLNVEILQP
jgi:hypothetical protein